MSITHGVWFYWVHMPWPHSIHNNESIKRRVVPDVHSLWAWPLLKLTMQWSWFYSAKVLKDVSHQRKKRRGTWKGGDRRSSPDTLTLMQRVGGETESVKRRRWKILHRSKDYLKDPIWGFFLDTWRRFCSIKEVSSPLMNYTADTASSKLKQQNQLPWFRIPPVKEIQDKF